MILISVLPPVVAVVSVPRLIPETLFVLLRVIGEPSAILRVFTVKVTLPAVPVASVPVWPPTLTVGTVRNSISKGYA